MCTYLIGVTELKEKQNIFLNNAMLHTNIKNFVNTNCKELFQLVTKLKMDEIETRRTISSTLHCNEIVSKVSTNCNKNSFYYSQKIA